MHWTTSETPNNDNHETLHVKSRSLPYIRKDPHNDNHQGHPTIQLPMKNSPSLH